MMLVVRVEKILPSEHASTPRQIQANKLGVPLIPKRKGRAPSANEPGTAEKDESGQRDTDERVFAAFKN